MYHIRISLQPMILTMPCLWALFSHSFVNHSVEREVFEDDEKAAFPKMLFLQQINEVSFAVNDMLLYLDTHPEDQKALRYFSDISDRRNQLMAEYAEKYGPLTIDSAAVSSENAWKWSQQPFPWEKEGA